MTKVLSRSRFGAWLAAWLLTCAFAHGSAAAAPAACGPSARELYSQLRSNGLDPSRVYKIRSAAIDRPNLHIFFEDGTIAFSQDVCGRITGAFFDGEGDVLLRPPNRVERESLALFTGMAILEEQFTSAYLRFNDDIAATLQPFLSPAESGDEFTKTWNDTSVALSEVDSLRLLLDFSYFLPSTSGPNSASGLAAFMHIHVLGKKHGAFELYWDKALPEPLWAGQPRIVGDRNYFDLWTSFVPSGAGSKATDAPAIDVLPKSFKIRAVVQPPTRLSADTDVTIAIRNGSPRTLFFELSRFLKIDSVRLDGKPLEFIQNQSLEGTQLRRKGNDLVAVVFPSPLLAGTELTLQFQYEGEPLSEAGRGLLYVGDRGVWYPNFGLSPANFDIEFQAPEDWTLVATGKSVPPDPVREKEIAPGQRLTHWVSERPIPVAGFNLGKYTRAEARSGNVVVQALGTAGVERSFPKPHSDINLPMPTIRPGSIIPAPQPMSPPDPSPARNAQLVATRAASAIDSFSEWFGPFPYGSLSLTQMPGDLSQGWPGLIFLSSLAFLSAREQADLHLNTLDSVLGSQVLVHETAHQWWGDLVLWKSYRDQWIVEALSEYSALMILEQKNPAQFHEVLERYRNDLLSENKEGERISLAGPVTMGQRLVSSHFPRGYEAISYERGTWLLHMLRSMLRDAEATSRSRNRRADPDEPFFRALRKVRERYADKPMTTRQFVQVFEEDLPRALWYERKKSLDWFFDGWVNGTAIPKIELHDVKISQKETTFVVSGTVVQKDAPDDLVTAVPIYGVNAANSQILLGIILADGSETSFRLTTSQPVRKVLADPKKTVLTALK